MEKRPLRSGLSVYNQPRVQSGSGSGIGIQRPRPLGVLSALSAAVLDWRACCDDFGNTVPAPGRFQSGLDSTRSNWRRAVDLEIGGADVAILKTVVRPLDLSFKSP
jgi:hypothetical protein